MWWVSQPTKESWRLWAVWWHSKAPNCLRCIKADIKQTGHNELPSPALSQTSDSSAATMSEQLSAPASENEYMLGCELLCVCVIINASMSFCVTVCISFWSLSFGPRTKAVHTFGGLHVSGCHLSLCTARQQCFSVCVCVCVLGEGVWSVFRTNHCARGPQQMWSEQWAG